VDSTLIKTNSYREVFKSHDPAIVEQIVSHHQQHAGISRVEKIDYAHRHILETEYLQEAVERDVRSYSQLVFEKVIQSDWVPGALEFVESYYRDIPLFVISGTPHGELNEIVNRRGMGHYFKEVLGSPTRKPEHIRALVAHHTFNIGDCVFVGDALTDYHAARDTGMDFIGIRSEVDFPQGTKVLPDCTGLAEAILEIKRK
jgi:HAD superfamily hydrolase (TIGR01549 family)